MSPTGPSITKATLLSVIMFLPASWSLPSDNSIEKRAPRDFGVFRAPCQNAEGACNNACFHINCWAKGYDPDANKVTYIGPNNGPVNDKNRVESGCQTSDGSVCGNFPFSQKWIRDQSDSGSYQCDEWPPAVSTQRDYPNKKQKNSLRCMPGPENGSLGAKIGNFINEKGGPYPGRPGGIMSQGDFFKIEFDITNADQSKVQYCKPNPDCTNDGFEFFMSGKSLFNQGGKISSKYNPGTDNQYTPMSGGQGISNLNQCSVELTRDGPDTFKDFAVFDWSNKDVTDPNLNKNPCTLKNPGDTCDIKGLPNDLIMKKTGGFNTKLAFTYAVAGNINFYEFDSDERGNGRGPATGTPSNPGDAYRFCKVDTNGSTQRFNCWFPCWRRADGK